MSAIAASDSIARCIIYDPLFSGSVHTDASLWIFGKRGTDGASHHSAVLRSIAVNDEDVHEVGCIIAASQNHARGEPPPGDKRRYYCGFRSAAILDLPLVTDRYRIELTLVPEHGIDSHVDVALTVVGITKQEQANQRTEAGLALAEAFLPAVPHVCECDRDDVQHPFIRFGSECLSGEVTGFVREVALAESKTAISPLSGRGTLAILFPPLPKDTQ